MARQVLGWTVLVLCVVIYTVQTALANFLSKDSAYPSAYATLWFSHSSLVLILPLQMIVFSPQQYLHLVARTSHTLWLEPRGTHYPPLAHPIKDIHTHLNLLLLAILLTSLLNTATYLWYVAVGLTSMSALTALNNTSCVFAYIFSVLILHERPTLSKSAAVILSFIGVFCMTMLTSSPVEKHTPKERWWGNLYALGSAMLTGLYEVLYKKYAVPTYPSVILSTHISGLIGLVTLVLGAFPLPILHLLGWEPFIIPNGLVAQGLVLNSMFGLLSNTFFMLLVAITSPVFAAVGILLTLPAVTLVDLVFFGSSLQPMTVIGAGFLIAGFYFLLRTSPSEASEVQEYEMLHSS
jgi:drug/metabolite transporter (DMT)-like permease